MVDSALFIQHTERVIDESECGCFVTEETSDNFHGLKTYYTCDRHFPRTREEINGIQIQRR